MSSPRACNLPSYELRVKVTFRLCKQADLPALEWMGLFTPHREIIERTFHAQQHGDAAMLLAVTKEYPVGQVWMDLARYRWDRGVYLWAVRVFPPLQSGGLGTRLIRVAELYARQATLRFVELGVEVSNAPACEFYERLGYRRAGTSTEETKYEYLGERRAVQVEQHLMRKSLAGLRRRTITAQA